MLRQGKKELIPKEVEQMEKRDDVLEKAEKAKQDALEADHMANLATVVSVVGIISAIVANLDKIWLFVNWLRSCLNL